MCDSGDSAEAEPETFLARPEARQKFAAREPVSCGEACPKAARGRASLWYYSDMIVLLLVMLGLVLGSFINALVWRLHEGKDWVTGRSECPLCHHQLAAKDFGTL